MLFPYLLPSVSYSAGGNATSQLKDLPKQVRGRIPHVRKFLFDVTYTPTTTALPTTVGNNNLVSACDFWDGRVLRFVGGFNHLRAKERLHTGKIRIPDANTDTASGTARYFQRVLHVGPPQTVNQADWSIPTGCLDSGEIRWTFGALTDLAADCTAATGTIRPVALCDVRDDIVIPPAYTFTRYTANSSDLPLPGRALYESVALLNSSSFDAITAGDFNSISFDMGQGPVVQGIHSVQLQTAWMDAFAVSEMGSNEGDRRGASGDNARVVNQASPLAIVAPTADMQIVYFTEPGSKITDMDLAETSARLSWDGSQTSGVVLAGRILPQPPSVVGAYASAALAAIKRQQKEIKVLTASKRGYNGPMIEFMPYKIKV